MPRDIDPGVNALEGVFLYDIDSLQAIAHKSIEIRRKDLSVCESMIERHVTDFSGWLSGAATLSPLGAAGFTPLGP